MSDLNRIDPTARRKGVDMDSLAAALAPLVAPTGTALPPGEPTGPMIAPEQGPQGMKPGYGAEAILGAVRDAVGPSPPSGPNNWGRGILEAAKKSAAKYATDLAAQAAVPNYDPGNSVFSGIPDYKDVFGPPRQKVR